MQDCNHFELIPAGAIILIFWSKERIWAVDGKSHRQKDCQITLIVVNGYRLLWGEGAIQNKCCSFAVLVCLFFLQLLNNLKELVVLCIIWFEAWRPTQGRVKGLLLLLLLLLLTSSSTCSIYTEISDLFQGT